MAEQDTLDALRAAGGIISREVIWIDGYPHAIVTLGNGERIEERL